METVYGDVYGERPVPRKDEREWDAKTRAHQASIALAPSEAFKCLHCGFVTAASKGKTQTRGITAHMGHLHRDVVPGKTPFMPGKDFVPVTWAEAGGRPAVVKRGKRGPYKRHNQQQQAALQPKKGISQQIRRALVDSEPSITLEFPLSDDITIRVPLILGPPTFVERNGNGS